MAYSLVGLDETLMPRKERIWSTRSLSSLQCVYLSIVSIMNSRIAEDCLVVRVGNQSDWSSDHANRAVLVRLEGVR